MRTVLTALAVSAIAIAAAPTGHAEPGPGSGETFFVEYMTRAFTPPTTEAAARALLPLAQQVCEAREAGQSDVQASAIVLADNGLETLGMATGARGEDEQTALAVVNASTLAYCPQYNASL